MSPSKKTRGAGPTGPYEVRLDDQPDEVLADMQEADYDNVWDVLQGMETQPRRPAGKRVAKLPDGTYRVRQGDWRIFYDVLDRDRLVLVVEVGRRNERTYKKRQNPRRR